MMNREFLPLAEEEMNEAARFDEERSSGLGRDFLDEVERTIESIAAHPHSGRKISENIRRRILGRFPFGILYTLERDRIVIVAVMHLHRQPGYWKARLGSDF
jgi:plasmid stabilization system protein ParE